jgi:hypothetical protein
VSVGDLPSFMVFRESPRSGTNHFWMEFGFIRFSLFRLFCRVLFGSSLPLVSVRPWKDGLSFRPVETVRLILQGRGCLCLTQNTIFFNWMRLRVFWTLRPSIAAFLHCHWYPGDFRFHRFGRRFRRSGPWRTFLVLFHVSAAGALTRIFSFLSCPVRFGWES